MQRYVGSPDGSHREHYLSGLLSLPVKQQAVGAVGGNHSAQEE